MFQVCGKGFITLTGLVFIVQLSGALQCCFGSPYGIGYTELENTGSRFQLEEACLEGSFRGSVW